MISFPSVLHSLESEALEIFREIAAAYREPVMPSSIVCYPLTGVLESNATTLVEITKDVNGLKLSERATRLIDGENNEAIEKVKTKGFF